MEKPLYGHCALLCEMLTPSVLDMNMLNVAQEVGVHNVVTVIQQTNPFQIHNLYKCTKFFTCQVKILNYPLFLISS